LAPQVALALEGDRSEQVPRLSQEERFITPPAPQPAPPQVAPPTPPEPSVTPETAEPGTPVRGLW
jgi:hypothetical protein